MVKHDPRQRNARTAKNYVEAQDWNPSPEEEKEIARWRSIYRAQPELYAKRHIQIIDRESARGAGIKTFVFNNCQKALHKLRDDIKEFNLERSKAQHKIDKTVQVSEYPLQLVILKPRKVGVSTYLQFLAFHRCEFEPQTACLIMAHEAAAAVNIMKISRRFDENFINDGAVIPAHLTIRQPLKRRAEMLMEWGRVTEDNAEGWGSHIVVKTAGTKVSGTSRSFTWHFVHLSEEAHFTTDAEVPPVMNARARACETYEESTANGVGGLFYSTWEKALPFEVVRKAYREGKAVPPWWNGKFQFFWSWLNDPDYRLYCEPQQKVQILETLNAREHQLMSQFGATVEQLNWRRMKIATECSSQSEMDPEEYFNQEFPTTPEDAFVSRGHNVFKQSALLRMSKENEYTQPAWKGDCAIDAVTNACVLMPEATKTPLKLWAEPKPNADYIIGVDTAEGLLRGDYTVISIFERCNDELLREAGRYRGKLPPEETAILAVHLAKKYNNAFIVPEANPPGNATCIKLVRYLQYPYVYHREGIERVQNENDMTGFTAGFKTTRETKPHLVTEGQGALRRAQIQLVDKDAIKEWLHYRNEDGKYSCPEGENDDCVIADMLCCFGHFTGKAPRLRQKSRLDDLKGLPADITQSELVKAVGRFIKRARRKNRREAARVKPILPAVKW